jgi:hypothetical protein
MTQGRQPHYGAIFGVEKSPEIPSLSNGVDVVVGGIAFIGKREPFWGS